MGLASWIRGTLKSLFQHNATNKTPHFLLTIETPRLMMREHRPEDVDRIHQISKTPGFVYYCFDGSREKAEEFIQEALRTQKANPATGMRDNHMLAIIDKATGELIGHACIERVNYVQGVDYEPNYFIDPAYQGKGYGPEALINLIHYAFSVMKLPALTSTQHPDNRKAIDIAQRVFGFKKIGEVTINTANGPEPRELSMTTPEDFYRLRQSDKRPMLSQSIKGPANG